MKTPHFSTHLFVFALSLTSGVLGADVDIDGVDDSIDLCCNTPIGVTVDAQGRPKGDLDGDCDVDQSDFAIFQANMTGPMTCPSGTCECPCQPGFSNCDGQAGCEVNLNSNPACGTFTEMGTVRGDTGGDVVTQNTKGEKWFHVTISEAVSTPFATPLTGRIRLSPPAGANYDLVVYCPGCGNSSFQISGNNGSAVETIYYQRNEATGGGSDDGRTLIIEVKFISGESCDNYQLEVSGNVTISTPLLNSCS